jgi:hypothetical protein
MHRPRLVRSRLLPLSLSLAPLRLFPRLRRLPQVVCIGALALGGAAHAATFKPEATVAATQSTLGCHSQALFRQAVGYGQAGQRREVGAMFDAKQCLVVQNGSRYKVQSVTAGSMELVPVEGADKSAVWADPEFFVEK